MPPTIEISTDDITTLAVDAIVNAANATLAGGGGVDGAIHRAAGPELMRACRAIGGCDPGDAQVTPGFALPARHVIHAVGPIWRGGGHGEAELLASCYRRAYEIAHDLALISMALPAISCGVYGYPHDQAARIAVGAARREAAGSTTLERILLVCVDPSVRRAYERVLKGDDA